MHSILGSYLMTEYWSLNEYSFFFKKVMGSNDDCLRKEYISVGKKWFFESSVVFSHLITFILVSNKQCCVYKHCTISFGNRYTVFDNFDQYSFFCQTGQGQGSFNWAQSETLDFRRKISYIPKEDITYTKYDVDITYDTKSMIWQIQNIRRRFITHSENLKKDIRYTT